MQPLINFMNSLFGRAARVLLGLALIYVGLFTLGGGTSGYIVAAIGLLPIALGLWGKCILQFVFPPAHNA